MKPLAVNSTHCFTLCPSPVAAPAVAQAVRNVTPFLTLSTAIRYEYHIAR